MTLAQGVSKEHRPNPIVQMGLFMDSDGIPLAFCINKGNTNEQVTLKPLEEKIKERWIKDDGLEQKLVVLTFLKIAKALNPLILTGIQSFFHFTTVKDVILYFIVFLQPFDSLHLASSSDVTNGLVI